MSVQVEKLEKNMVKFTIEVPAEKLEAAIQKAYLKQKGQIAIPGFRKGKVPRQIIEKMYGPSVFYEEATNELIPDAFTEAVREQSDLRVLTRPNVNIEQIEKGKPFIFTAEVAVFPEVTLGEYKGLEVPIQDRSVSEEEIEAALKKEQEKNSRKITVDDRAAEMGDTVILDYSGTVDGEKFEGGTAELQSLKLGSGTFIPGFEEQLVGVGIDEEKDVEVTFPEDYSAKELAGKAAVFHCVLHSIETTELPELDDDFAQDVSEFNTLAEYKDSIKAKLEEEKADRAKAEIRKAAAEKAAKNASMDLPDLLIRDNAEQMAESFAQRLESQGIPFQQYLQYLGMNPQQFISQYKEDSEAQLRHTFTLDKIADAEGIEITDEDVEKSIAEAAASYGMDVEKYREILPEDYAFQMKEELKIARAADLVAEAAVETEAATKEAEEAAKAAEVDMNAEEE